MSPEVELSWRLILFLIWCWTEAQCVTVVLMDFGTATLSFMGSQYVTLRSGLLVKFGILVQSSLRNIFTQSQPFFGLSLVWCHSRAGIFSRPSSSVKHRVTELNVLQRLPQSQHLTMKSWNERFVSDKPGATGRHVNVYQTKWLMGVHETVREPTLKQI